MARRRKEKKSRGKVEAIVIWHDDGEVFIRRGGEIRPHRASCSDEFLEIAVAVLEEVKRQTSKATVLKAVPPKGKRRAGRSVVAAAYVVFVVDDG